VDEYCIKPQNALFILGTLAENTGLQVSPKPVATQHGAALNRMLTPPQSFGATSASTANLSLNSAAQPPVIHQEVIRLTPESNAGSSASMSQQSKVAAALMKAGITNPAAWAAAGISDPVAPLGRSAGSASATAPAVAVDLSTFDLQPSVVLNKGDNDRTFLISWRSERDLVSSLGWKATACIWGGPALTLLGVYVLLISLGWL
jgi:hypothetical protein